MSTIQTIFWWVTLVVSLTINIYQLITTGASDSTHLLVTLISMAVIDLSRQIGGTNGLQKENT